MERHYSTDLALDTAVRLGGGQVLVRPAAEGTASVEVRAVDPGHEPSVRLAESAEVRLEGRHLAVFVPGQGRVFRRGEVVVDLRLPADSRLAVKAGLATVGVTGGLEELDARIGAGSVEVDRVGELHVKAGQVDVVVGRARALTVASGQGSLRAAESGDAAFKSGSGSVELGRSTGAVQVKGGSVQLVVGEAVSGEVFFNTGSGDARVSVATGTTVELDLISGSGDVRCELPLESSAPAGGAGLRVRLRTGSGDLLVTSSVPAAVPAVAPGGAPGGVPADGPAGADGAA